VKKILTLFQRNYETDKLVREEVTPGAEWVLEGYGVATRKFDGAACRVIERVLYKRYDAGCGRTPPDTFIPAQDPDPVTGRRPGWVRVNPGDAADRWHLEAFDHYVVTHRSFPPDGTYELVGPKVQGNAEGHDRHALVAHGSVTLDDVPRAFRELRDYLAAHEIEGVIWHRADGEMVKLKRRDFGLRWPLGREARLKIPA
jgi:hypothetical protein